MAKTLVAYFSATGITKNVAERLANVAKADIYEIKPTVPYTEADLNWMDIVLTIINTFLESYDFSGKKIVLFATSGGNGFGNAVTKLKSSIPGADIIEGALYLFYVFPFFIYSIYIYMASFTCLIPLSVSAYRPSAT